MQNGNETADSWEKLAESAGISKSALQSNTTTSTNTADPNAPKVRKPLKRPAKAQEFMPTAGVQAATSFLKEEVPGYVKADDQAQSNVNANTNTNTNTNANVNTNANIGSNKKPQEEESKKEQPKVDTEKTKEKEKGDKKVDVKKPAENTKDKRELKRLQQEAKKREAKKTVIDIESVLKDKSKYDVEVDEQREPLNIVTIGHVDAGKSTICGGLLLWTGKVDMNELRKLELEAKDNNRESWYLAYLMDINEEEKAKGKTVEVGRATFELENRRFTLLDAPGHKNYVPNMIQGAAQADVACLVISAKAGEFESGYDKGGQTREHAMLARSLGVTDLIVLINKMDETSVNWSIDRFNEIKDKLGVFLQKACGYSANNVKWVPISGLFGINVKDKVDPKVCSWYKGDKLLDIFNNIPIPKRDRNGVIRMPVLDKVKEQGGVHILGKVESGTIHPGQVITILPNCDEITVLAVLNNDDQKIPYGKPGENVKILVKGVDEDNVSKGDILCSNESWTHVCEQFEARISILELPEHKPIMSNGYTCVLHMHTALEEIEITNIISEFDKHTKENKSARYLKSGYIGTVRIQTKNPICCEKFEVMPNLGRFTLRDEGKTIAMGRITKIKPLFKD